MTRPRYMTGVTVVLLAVSLAATLAPVASGHRGFVPNDPDGEVAASPSAVQVTSASDGFDWASAAIGGAVGAGALLILLAAMVGLKRRRREPLLRGGVAGIS